MKLPVSVGQKKTKAIEMVLEELGLGKMMVTDGNTTVTGLAKSDKYDYILYLLAGLLKIVGA